MPPASSLLPPASCHFPPVSCLLPPAVPPACLLPPHLPLTSPISRTSPALYIPHLPHLPRYATDVDADKFGMFTNRPPVSACAIFVTFCTLCFCCFCGLCGLVYLCCNFFFFCVFVFLVFCASFCSRSSLVFYPFVFLRFFCVVVFVFCVSVVLCFVFLVLCFVLLCFVFCVFWFCACVIVFCVSCVLVFRCVCVFVFLRFCVSGFLVFVSLCFCVFVFCVLCFRVRMRVCSFVYFWCPVCSLRVVWICGCVYVCVCVCAYLVSTCLCVTHERIYYGNISITSITNAIYHPRDLHNTYTPLHLSMSLFLSALAHSSLSLSFLPPLIRCRLVWTHGMSGSFPFTPLASSNISRMLGMSLCPASPNPCCT